MGYKVKPFHMKVRDNETEDFKDVTFLGSNVVAGSFMQNKGRLANGTDLNTIADNSIYMLGGQTGAQYVHNALADGAGYLTTKSTNGIVLQVCEALSGARYSRYSEDSGSTWSNWVL